MSHDVGAMATASPGHPLPVTTAPGGQFRAKGFRVLCPANTATVSSYRFSADRYVGLTGGAFRAIGSTTEQDFVDAEIVDLDNALGLVAGLPVGLPLPDPTTAPVIDHYIQSVYTGDKGDLREFRPGSIGWIPPGLYVRVTYTSAGSGITELLWDVQYFVQSAGFTP